jgi:hypothetical protein
VFPSFLLVASYTGEYSFQLIVYMQPPINYASNKINTHFLSIGTMLHSNSIWIWIHTFYVSMISSICSNERMTLFLQGLMLKGNNASFRHCRTWTICLVANTPLKHASIALLSLHYFLTVSLTSFNHSAANWLFNKHSE